MRSSLEKEASEAWIPETGMLYVCTFDFPPFPQLAGSKVSTIQNPHARQLLIYYKPYHPHMGIHFYGKLFQIYEEDHYQPKIPSVWEGFDQKPFSQITNNVNVRIERVRATDIYLLQLMDLLKQNVGMEKLESHFQNIRNFVKSDHLLQQEMKRLYRAFQQS